MSHGTRWTSEEMDAYLARQKKYACVSPSNAPFPRPDAPPERSEDAPRVNTAAATGERKAEKAIAKDFLAWLAHHEDRLYWIVARSDRKSTIRAGHPDVTVFGLRDGRFTALLIELKTATGKVSEDQRMVHAWLERIAAPVIVCRSAMEAISQTKEFFGT